MIKTERLNLVPWHECHRSVFAAMHADPAVMLDLGGPISRRESDAKFDRYDAAYAGHSFSRWAVENRDGAFFGYAGVMPCVSPGHPLGPHCEVGWRFTRAAWGNGFASESARAALDDIFRRTELVEILSYTDAANMRSQAVMARLNLRRETSRDFIVEYERVGAWQGMVWVAERTQNRESG